MRLYLLGCHICEIFKNCVKIVTQALICHSRIDSVNIKPIPLKSTLPISTNSLIYNPKIHLDKPNKHTPNFYNQKNSSLNQDNKEAAIKEGLAMGLLSTNENNLTLSIMDSPCNLVSYFKIQCFHET